MRLGRHIALVAALGTPALALTPLPPCSGQMIAGKYETWYSQAAGKGFVTYHGKSRTSDKMLLVLEHCKTGKSVLVNTFWNDGAKKPGNLDLAIEALDGFIESNRNYSLRAITRGLKKAGFKASQKTLGPESCACKVHFPDDRGDRKAFAF